MDDMHDLARFVAAQDPLYPSVCAELEAGRKTSHWMWFVFPQLAGLGHSPMARRYAIASRDEAEAYLAHPVLGPRLRHCIALVLATPGSAHAIFGEPDTTKLRSCLTLFDAVAPEDIFAGVLERFFATTRDAATLEGLRLRDQTPRTSNG